MKNEEKKGKGRRKMSIFHCNGCDKTLDSDNEGYHQIDEGVFYCDECEAKEHSIEYQESMKHLRMLLGKCEA